MMLIVRARFATVPAHDARGGHSRMADRGARRALPARERARRRHRRRRGGARGRAGRRGGGDQRRRMSGTVRRLQHPAQRVAADEGLHAPPPEAADRLFGDTVWLSMIDPARGIWGFIHNHIAPNRGYGRMHAYFLIDGVEHFYAGKTVGGLEFGDMRWSDG